MKLIGYALGILLLLAWAEKGETVASNPVSVVIDSGAKKVDTTGKKKNTTPATWSKHELDSLYKPVVIWARPGDTTWHTENMAPWRAPMGGYVAMRDSHWVWKDSGCLKVVYLDSPQGPYDTIPDTLVIVDTCALNCYELRTLELGCYVLDSTRIKIPVSKTVCDTICTVRKITKLDTAFFLLDSLQFATLYASAGGYCHPPVSTDIVCLKLIKSTGKWLLDWKEVIDPSRETWAAAGAYCNDSIFCVPKWVAQTIVPYLGAQYSNYQYYDSTRVTVDCDLYRTDPTLLTDTVNCQVITEETFVTIYERRWVSAGRDTTIWWNTCEEPCRIPVVECVDPTLDSTLKVTPLYEVTPTYAYDTTSHECLRWFTPITRVTARFTAPAPCWHMDTATFTTFFNASGENPDYDLGDVPVLVGYEDIGGGTGIYKYSVVTRCCDTTAWSYDPVRPYQYLVYYVSPTLADLINRCDVEERCEPVIEYGNPYQGPCCVDTVWHFFECVSLEGEPIRDSVMEEVPRTPCDSSFISITRRLTGYDSTLIREDSLWIYTETGPRYQITSEDTCNCEPSITVVNGTKSLCDGITILSGCDPQPYWIEPDVLFFPCPDQSLEEAALDSLKDQVVTKGILVYYSDSVARVWTRDSLRDPTGFQDPEHVVVEYDSTARTITLSQTGGIKFWWRGKLLDMGTTWTSDPHDIALDVYYLAFMDDTIPEWSTTVWDFDMGQIAAVHYDSLYKFALKETHGTMPWATHRVLHHNIGTYRISGGELLSGTYEIQPASPVDSMNDPTFLMAVIADEDNVTDLAQVDQGSYTHLKFYSDGTPWFTYNEPFPFDVASTYPYINTYSGGTFGWTETSTNEFFNIYQVLVPTSSDAGSLRYEMLMMQPQKTYSTIEGAQAETFLDIQKGQLSSVSDEYVAYAKITYRTSAGYTGASGRVRISAVSYLTGSSVTQTSSTSGSNAADHIQVAFTPDYYTPADPTVEEHLKGLDDALGKQKYTPITAGSGITVLGDTVTGYTISSSVGSGGVGLQSLQGLAKQAIVLKDTASSLKFTAVAYDSSIQVELKVDSILAYRRDTSSGAFWSWEEVDPVWSAVQGDYVNYSGLFPVQDSVFTAYDSLTAIRTALDSLHVKDTITNGFWAWEQQYLDNLARVSIDSLKTALSDVEGAQNYTQIFGSNAIQVTGDTISGYTISADSVHYRLKSDAVEGGQSLGTLPPRFLAKYVTVEVLAGAGGTPTLSLGTASEGSDLGSQAISATQGETHTFVVEQFWAGSQELFISSDDWTGLQLRIIVIAEKIDLE